ncbi:hypothetical protein [Nocardia salmonicida]|uniref:hypothetical protein n=1 Tax=Nocardia salmonicida TaxID=53431 RepID=UPI00378D03E8
MTERYDLLLTPRLTHLPRRFGQNRRADSPRLVDPSFGEYLPLQPVAEIEANRPWLDRHPAGNALHQPMSR